MTGQILTMVILIVFVALVLIYLSDMLLVGMGILAVFVVLRVAWMLIGSKE